jgi:lipopolysaccharide export system permease protein
MILKKYFLQTFSQTFFPIFLTLFLVTSIIFLVKIASLTSIIQLNFLELMELFSYNIPTILFYTLPVTIFISLCLSLSKLSSEYELIVVTSFGQKPLKILKIFFPFLITSTFLVLFIALLLIPKSLFLKEQFIENKKTEAQFNIKPSEYGQEFGKWLIYVNKEEKGLYQDIVLYEKSDEKNVFIIAKYATIKNINNALNLNLEQGKVFNISDSISQINFKKMVIHNELKKVKKINTINEFIEYWNDEYDKLAFYILGSFFPFLSLFIILYAGYYNPRYERNRSVVISLSATVLFIVLIQKFSKSLGLELLVYFPIAWFSAGYFLYYLKIKQAY